MSWKENLEEKKQRQEAIRYFRNNNKEFFDSKMWVRLIAMGTVAAIAGGTLYALFVMITHLHMGYVIALLGIAISKILKKVAGTGNRKVAILTIVFYVLAILFSYVFSTVMIYFQSIPNSSLIHLLFDVNIWKIAMQSMTNSGMFTGIIYLIGGLYAYQNALYD